MDVFVCCLLPSRSYIISIFTEQCGLFFLFLIRVAGFHSITEFTVFFAPFSNCTCLKLESKWIIVFSFSFSSLFEKQSIIKYLFDLWRTFLLQSVVQSSNRFSIVPINVASFFSPFDQCQHYFCVIFNEEFDLLPNTIIMSRPKKKVHAQTGWVGCFLLS